MKNLFEQVWLRNTALVLAGLLFGWILFAGNTSEVNTDEHAHSETGEVPSETIWTCSMHPQVRQSEPGSCPICGMDLIPAESGNGGAEVLSKAQLQMTETAAQIAEIQTTEAVRKPAVQQMALPGKIAVDERRISSVTAHFPGRIKSLLVNYTGEYVQKGQTLARIYSPSLITAQKELLEAMQYKEDNPALYAAARRKLELWELPETQIRSIEQNKEVITEVAIVSPVTGYVTQRMISREDHVKEGTVMYEIADLSKVWGIFEAYESDISALEIGDSVEFRVDALPGRMFSARISYIDPVLQADTRTVRVRTEIENKDRRLKPEMIAQATVQAKINDGEPVIQVPASAVLWTGERSLVYVKVPQKSKPTFEAREVVLGSRLGESYVILEGLSEGEQVVTHGTFKLDSAAQLAGKTSMMNRTSESEKPMVAPEHQHSEMQDTYPSSFAESFRTKLDPYFNLKDGLVASDEDMAGKQAELLVQSLDQIAMHSLTEEQHMSWVQVRSQINEHAQEIAKTTKIEAQRESFYKLSSLIIAFIKKAHISDLGYQMHCPMAFGEGADWISREDEVRNPYYGDQMLTCGSVVFRI